ncbi:MAG: hypothetical protein ACR2QK_15565 [Acidimicrobiales bacterium]
MTSRVRVAAVAVICSLALAACTDDGSDESSDDGSQVSAVPIDSTTVPGGDGVGATTSTAPQPELAVPALVGETASDITVGGYVFEFDGVYFLCEGATESDPPECDGETLEIANGDVIDPIIFIGDPGSQYSDAEVVVTGDVADGVLTIG